MIWVVGWCAITSLEPRGFLTIGCQRILSPQGLLRSLGSANRNIWGLRRVWEGNGTCGLNGYEQPGICAPSRAWLLSLAAAGSCPFWCVLTPGPGPASCISYHPSRGQREPQCFILTSLLVPSIRTAVSLCPVLGCLPRVFSYRLCQHPTSRRSKAQSGMQTH